MALKKIYCIYNAFETDNNSLNISWVYKQIHSDLDLLGIYIKA